MNQKLKLEVTGLNVKYGNVHALKGLNFKLFEGQIVCLIGANGAGKTTTLRAISGYVDYTGDVKLNQDNIQGKQSYELVSKGLIHCPEGRGVFPNLTVFENLQLGISGRPNAKLNWNKNLENCYHLFPRIKERVKQLAGTLSGGEQQMLAICRALLAEPEVLLLDEPSLGLAPQVVKLIFDIIVKINKENKVSVLLVEQNAKQALKVSHYAYVLEAGNLSLEGTGKELLENDQVRRIYLGDH